MKKVSGYPIINLTKRKETTDEMKCIKFVVIGHHLTFAERQVIEKLWNANAELSAKSRLSMTAFTKKYNIPKTTLQRELKRGCPEGIFHMYDKAKKEHWYYKYSAVLAQEGATLQGSRKGPRGA